MAKSEFPELESGIEKFFDSIGFTDERVKNYRSEVAIGKSVRDNIWGMIDIPASHIPLIDNPLFQRLRQLSQLGFTRFTYPTATHCRFDHSLGVYAACRNLISEVRRTCDRARTETKPGRDLEAATIELYQEELLLRAALLHDIGHGPYSHVTEKYFTDLATEVDTKATIGGASLWRIIYLFNRYYQSGSASPHSTAKHIHSKKKSLSEIVAVLLITSKRFRDFYSCALPGRQLISGIDDVDAIGCLILGDAIQEDDYALPQILHGAVDVDKIDYMLRDADSCGISISIDKSRALRDAGVYWVSADKDPLLPPTARSDGRHKVYVIDKFGGDTYEQMGASRLSLYSRVYHHPVTRKFELFFLQLLRTLGDIDPSLHELFNVWTKSEVELTSELVAHSDVKVRSRAERFVWRDLFRRSLVVSVDSAKCTLPTGARESAIPEDGKHLKKLVEQRVSSDALKQICTTLTPEVVRERALEIMGRLDMTLDPAMVESFEVGFLHGAEVSDSVLPPARMIDKINGELRKTDGRYAGYFDAGLIPNSQFIVWANSTYREYASVAFALEFARANLDQSLLALAKRISEDQGPARSDEPISIAVPLMDWVAQRGFCKINSDEIEGILTRLSEKVPHEPLIWLQAPHLKTAETKSIAEKFKGFSGALDFRIDEAGVCSFLRQFPFHLREEMSSFLLNDVQIVSREKVSVGLRSCLEKARLPDEIDSVVLAPLTATSGHQALTFLKGGIPSSVGGKKCFLENSLSDALTRHTSSAGIVLFDDHSASGTQAKKQLESYLGQSHGDETNIFHTPLPPGLLEAFRERHLALAFVYVGDDGERKIRAAAEELGLKCFGVLASEKLANISGIGRVSEDLRNFLRSVGTGTMLNKRMGRMVFDSEDEWTVAVSEAEANALGYDNMESAMVTAFNVPSSTYTALWRPGFYDPTGRYEKASDCCYPWAPLFLRGTQVHRRVLY